MVRPIDQTTSTIYVVIFNSKIIKLIVSKEGESRAVGPRTLLVFPLVYAIAVS